VTARAALVTGAAGALGTAISIALAERGWSVALAGLPGEPLDALAERLGAAHGVRATVHVGDLGVADQASGVVDDAWDAHGGLHGLVNNAGRPTRSTFATLSIEEWDASMAVNLRAPMLTMQAFAARWSPDQGSGAIVNVSSRTYASGGPPAYVAAKAGLVGLTRAAAFEFGPRGIRVNAIAPSMLVTPFTAGSRTAEQLAASADVQARMSALRRVPDVSEIAASAAYLLGPDSSFVTGEVLHVAGGLQLPPVPS